MLRIRAARRAPVNTQTGVGGQEKLLKKWGLSEQSEMSRYCTCLDLISRSFFKFLRIVRTGLRLSFVATQQPFLSEDVT